jgi:hypothetical protein
MDSNEKYSLLTNKLKALNEYVFELEMKIINLETENIKLKSQNINSMNEPTQYKQKSMSFMDCMSEIGRSLPEKYRKECDKEYDEYIEKYKEHREKILDKKQKIYNDHREKTLNK